MACSDATLYKIILDFYYKLFMQKRKYDFVLEKIIPITVKFYQGITKKNFAIVMTDINLIRTERHIRLQNSQIDG